jgi:hypothetical protein
LFYIKLSQPKSDIEEEPQQPDPDAEILELRRKLIENLNQRRLLKKQQEQELKEQDLMQQQKKELIAQQEQKALKEREQRIDEDMDFFKRKLIEHEQVLNVKEAPVSKRSAPVPLSNISNNNSSGASKNIKLSPILIRINPMESSSEEEDEDDDEQVEANEVVSPKTSIENSLQKNIGHFLQQAKQMAVKSLSDKNDKNKSVITENQRIVTIERAKDTKIDVETSKIAPLKQVQSVIASSTPRIVQIETSSQSAHLESAVSTILPEANNEQDKKIAIKSLRDRVNLKR